MALACALWPRAALPHAQATTTVQFDREIVRILDNHCVMCHMEKGPAFPLVTYEQTYAARWQIRQSVLDRHMAPWAAIAGYGDFANDNGLTQREIDFLVSWAESYGPRNNGSVYTGVAVQTPSKPVQARTDFERWVLGKPDALLSMPANTVAPRQQGQIKRAIINPKLKSEKWLRGFEYKPGDRRVVHAVSFAIQESGQWIGSWTPWHGFVSLPEGLALRLPAGSHIVAEIHYYGSTESVVDQGSLGLYFAQWASARVVSNLILETEAPPTAPGSSGTRSASTASGTSAASRATATSGASAASRASGASQKLLASTRLNADTNVLALQPAIRPGLESVEVSARVPNAATQVMLFAKDIAPDWPTPYVYRTPVALPKGTELFVIEHYAKDATIPTAGSPITFSVYEGPAIATNQPATPQVPVSTRRFELSGTVKSVDAANGRLLVEHGDIPGLMGAMTMSYSVGQRENLKPLTAGDEIRADVVVSNTTSHLENIEVTKRPPP